MAERAIKRFHVIHRSVQGPYFTEQEVTGTLAAVKMAAFWAGQQSAFAEGDGSQPWEAVSALGEMVPNLRRGVRAGREDEWVLHHRPGDAAPVYILIEPVVSGKAKAE